MIFDSVQAVLNIFVLVGVGIVLSRVKWITPQNRSLLSKLVVLLAVPCTIFNKLLTAIDKDSIATAGSMLVIPALTISLMYFGGWLFGKYVLRLRQNRQRTFAAMAGCPNTVFFGLPVVIALFGDAGIPIAMYFFIFQTTLFWSFGNAGIQADAQGKGEFSIGTLLKKVFSVNVIIIIIVFVMALTDIKPPDMLTTITQYIGNLSTPLSLFFSGNALYEIYSEYGFRGLKLNRDVFAVILARFLVAPLVALGFCTLFGVTGMMRTVCVLMSGMPIMINTVILCGAYGADRDYAALSFFWTVLCSIVILPLYVIIMG